MRTPFVVVDRSIAGLEADEVVGLDDDALHHLGTVLRREDGDALVVGDGRGATAPAELRGTSALLTGDATVVPPRSPTVTVVHALPKGRGFDEVVRTLAELGVSRIVPVVTARTESRPGPAKHARLVGRWRSIARAAAEQAHSAHLCAVEEPSSLDVTLREHAPGDRSLVADPTASIALAAGIRAGRPDAPVRLVVGPEGGLTAAEVEAHEEVGWLPVRAGDTVLRSVNAATVLVAATLALTGHFGAM